MLTRDRIGALLLLAFSIFYGVRTLYIPLLPFQAEAAFTARSMPWALSVLGVVLSVALLLQRGTGARVAAVGFRWDRAALLCALMVAYGLTVRPGGFLISTSLFLIGGFVILGERRVWLILVASIPIVVFFWVLMTQFLGVFIEPWPEILQG
jgi:putative tricarboxylic transport membrane protein